MVYNFLGYFILTLTHISIFLYHYKMIFSKTSFYNDDNKDILDA
jgi:hypothetical protein